MKRIILKIHLLLPVALCFFLLCTTVHSDALSGFNEGEVAVFSTPSEVTYTATRAKTISFGAFDWKITDADGFSTGKEGLATDGTVALMKRNPINSAEGFKIEIVYTTDAQDADVDSQTAFLTMSASGFGTSVAMTDKGTTIGIAENGDVYCRGEKINHKNGCRMEDMLTAKSSAIASGEECVLTVQYVQGQLSVSVAHGGKKVRLVDNYECGAMTGLRQLQLGGDKNTAKRVGSAVYRSVSFIPYGEYVPYIEKTLQAVVQSDAEVKEYSRVDEALFAAKKSAHDGKRTVLKLYTDLKLTHPLEVQGGWNFTIDLNGFVLERGAYGGKQKDGYVITVLENGKLGIEDSSPESTRYSTTIRGGVITGGAGSSVGGCILLSTNAVLNIEGGSIVGCVTDDHGGAIRVLGDNVKINISNAGFYSNRTYDSTDNCHGGAIYGDNDCRINIDNTLFEANYSEDNGGAIYLNDGQLQMDNCLFYANKALDDGGAVYVESGACATMDNCRFYGNRSDGDGGAVYCNSSGGTRLTGRLLGNTAGGNGGAIYVNADSVCLADAEVRDNCAGGFGSGIYVDEMYDLNVQGILKVKGNINSKNVSDDVFLDSTLFASAAIYDGGLYDGSEVYVRTNDSNHTVLENVSEYQARFFMSDDPGRRLAFTADPARPEFYSLITSAVGEGNIVFIFICTVLAAAFVTFLILRRRKIIREGEKK